MNRREFIKKSSAFLFGLFLFPLKSLFVKTEKPCGNQGLKKARHWQHAADLAG